MKVQTKIPDKNKWYPVRAGDSLVDLKKWMKWAKKNYPKQKLLIVDYYSPRMKDKVYKDYWKARYMGGTESKYMVYGTY